VVRRPRRTDAVVRSWPADAALSTTPVVRGARGASLSTLSGRRQPFYDAVVGELGAAAVIAARTHRSPLAVPRCRHHWTRCRRPWKSRGCTDDEAESTTALTPGSIANRCAPAAAVCAAAVRSCCRVCVVWFFLSFSCPEEPVPCDNWLILLGPYTELLLLGTSLLLLCCIDLQLLLLSLYRFRV